jgi:hypothetical protein
METLASLSCHKLTAQTASPATPSLIWQAHDDQLFGTLLGVRNNFKTGTALCVCVASIAVRHSALTVAMKSSVIDSNE